jgi:polyvinyl alcohol dehydrogenase (cytochrome)
MSKRLVWASPAIALAAVFGFAALFGPVGLARSQAADAPTTPGGPPPPPSEQTIFLGQNLYGDRCSKCHDEQGGRAPPKADLQAHTADDIVAILTSGPMKPMAKGMAPEDIAAVASYLTGRTPTGAGALAAAPSQADINMCKGHAPAILPSRSDWNGWGRDLANTRYQPDPGLKSADVGKLKVKWAFAYPGGHSSQATLIGGRLFFTTSSGRLYSLDAATGCVWWRQDIDVAVRTSPVVVAVAKSVSPSGYALFYGDAKANAAAVDAATGKPLWKTRVDTHLRALITGSPVYFKGRLYVPVSSLEEGASMDKTYGCCTFRGSIAALDAATGKLVWQTYPIDKAPAPFKLNSAGVQMFGPAGGAIWMAPTIDAKRGLLYVGTGDSYTDVDTKGDDAIVAMRLSDGKLQWVNQVTTGDNFLVGCGRKPDPANCPETLGPDFDFGASPVLTDLGHGKQIVLAGQKSGLTYGFDPDHGGKLLWTTRVGRGGALGGVEWGMAASPHALFVAVSDISAPKSRGGNPGLNALGAAKGDLLWHVDAPAQPVCHKPGRCSSAFSAAVTAIPGAVFSGSEDGHMRAYAAKDGALLWDFDTTAEPFQAVNTGAPVNGGVLDATGATVSRGMVYLESGYGGFGAANGGMAVLLAFSVDGK